jgi:tRNA-2-methylthio-N6-dimethylallyladenosine synthase
MKTTRKIFLETFGCQMNMADSEIVLSILNESGYRRTDSMASADVFLLNTCSVRENAEQRVYGRLGDFNHYKKANPAIVIGVLGCMAERLRKELLESDSSIDLVVGPDEYRKLPAMIEAAAEGEKGIAVKLSRTENYDDIVPLRTEGLSAWLSIMRGCDKFCTYCVVPFTRGRERSRTLSGIVREVEELARRGFKEITLLGQNVNSYRDGEYDFAALLAASASVDRSVRIRFMTSHPQDMSDTLIRTITEHENICHSIHLPVQSGSDRILELMNRSYTIDHYRSLVTKIKAGIPDVALSTDIITGFPTETEDDHRRTLDLIRETEFDGAYTFKYSPRANTKAWQMKDDVPEETKARRLDEIIDCQRSISLRMNHSFIGSTVEVMVEGASRRSDSDLCGRTGTNKMVVFPKNGTGIGSTVRVTIDHVNSATLFGLQQHAAVNG